MLGKGEGTGFAMPAMTVYRDLITISKGKDEHRGGFDLVQVWGGRGKKVNETLNKNLRGSRKEADPEKKGKMAKYS